MARPRNADGQRTRQAILDAALDLFAEKGFFGTSLRDVAAAVGVRESALYNYFAGKDALFDALLSDHEHSRAERLSPIAEGRITDGRAVLVQVATAMLEGFTEPREEKMFRILMSDGMRLTRTGRINMYERLHQGREQRYELFRRLMRDGWLRQSDVVMVGLAFVSPLITWRQLHAINADLPMIRNPRAFVRQHVDQFLLGAATPGWLEAKSPRRVASRRKAS